MKPHLFRSLVGLVSLIVVFLVAMLPAPAPGAVRAGAGSASSFDAIVPDLDPSRERYLAEPGEDPTLESQHLLAMGDYFYHRVSYPTGQFDSAWYAEARTQDEQIQRGVPEGEVTYTRASVNSPLALNPNRFTSIGPAPLQSNGCIGCYSYGLVSGRTNVIAVDPVTPNVAYLGSDGGGVWKSTNCCSANTTWTPVTDDPLLSTIAIGDIVIDPNDHNTVYAGTGDLRFGSFSFGSAGLLKSTDQGATWTVLGEDAFNAAYTQPGGVFRNTRPSARCKSIPTTAAGWWWEPRLVSSFPTMLARTGPAPAWRTATPLSARTPPD